jgi:hypothetical protein
MNTKNWLSTTACKRLVLLHLSLIFTGFLFGQTSGRVELPYKPDEKLYYEMSYGFIVGGKAVLELNESLFKGNPVYHARAIGQTVGIADKVFGVYDIYESYFDPATCLPFQSVSNVKEGKYKRFLESVFDHSLFTVKNNEKDPVKIKKSTYDVISAFYLIRKDKLDNIKPGQIIRINTIFNGDPWEMVIRFKGLETIKLDIGKIECMKFKPVVEKGTFENEDALSIWISADQNRVPVRAQMEFFVGSFKTDLVKYSGLKYDLKLIPK